MHRVSVEFQFMKDFIFIPGHAINPLAISHIKYNPDGSVQVAVGSDVLTFTGANAKVFFDAAPAPVATPAAKAAKAEKE